MSGPCGGGKIKIKNKLDQLIVKEQEGEWDKKNIVFCTIKS